MRLIDVQQQIQKQNRPVFTTNDIASVFNITTSHASHVLKRLVDINYLSHLSKSLWCIVDKVELLMLPEYLTAPFPSYISLQSALYHYGMISQIPEVCYAVSIARTKVYATALGAISIHHIHPKLFNDYRVLEERQIKIATPEKALIDFFYLKPAKNALFRRLPELTLPKKFNKKHALHLADTIPSLARRTMVKESLLTLFD